MEPAPPAEPPAPTRIREAAAEDLPAIVGIYIRAYAQPPWLEHHEPAGAERYLRWVLGVPQTFGLVVEEAGQVRGFILAGRRAYADFVEDWERLADPPPEGWPPVPGQLGYIWELAVDPGAQRCCRQRSSACAARGWRLCCYARASAPSPPPRSTGALASSACPSTSATIHSPAPGCCGCARERPRAEVGCPCRLRQAPPAEQKRLARSSAQRSAARAGSGSAQAQAGLTRAQSGPALPHAGARISWRAKK